MRKTSSKHGIRRVDEIASMYAYDSDEPLPLPRVSFLERVAMFLLPRVWARVRAAAFTAGWEAARANLAASWSGNELRLSPVRIARVARGRVMMVDPTRPARSWTIKGDRSEAETASEAMGIDVMPGGGEDAPVE